MRRLWGVLLVCGCAHAPAAKDETASLVAAERAFAADASARTVNEAFLTAFGDSGVLFRPTPVNAHRALGERPMRATADLKWTPIYAETSADGTLGYTTGPATIGQRGQPPAGSTWFVSVWQRTANGWRLRSDGGIQASIVPLDSAPKLLTTHSSARTYKKDDSMIALERELIGNYARVFARVADEKVRVMRDGAMPTPEYAAGMALVARDPTTEFQPVHWETASSNDLGFVYGIVNAGAKEPGSYERIYRRNAKGEWRIVVDWRS